MSRTAKLYKCPVCDTVIEVLEDCGLELVCCGPEMTELTERVCNHHQPHALVAEKCSGTVKVRVGRQPHPMDEDHHIAWIELIADGQSCRRFLRPGEPPEAIFSADVRKCVIRAYCNAHGLWRSSDGPRSKARRQVAKVAV